MAGSTTGDNYGSPDNSFRPSSLFIAAPFLLLWLFSPVIAWSVSRQRTRKDFTLSDSEAVFYRCSVVKHGLFEDFVVAEDNYLPLITTRKSLSR
ncbi:hypothetical protein LWM68_00250 [Niabella sp. W65]|nr:hypothetical protein [Niabella sp. W65]MCH7361353.1 hypothetical protein [Niabella sp. W65]ULT45166.1 hypothetical protein KRR40_18830 [Niabella sp. I65]